jgi:integrase
MATGIIKRHSGDCPGRDGGRCRCNAGWEASVYSPRDRKKIRKRFPRESEARSWRADAKRALDRGTLRAPSAITLREAAEAWLAGVEAGEITNRSGHPFKPATLRGYRRDLERKVLPELGGRKLGAVATSDLQGLVDRWQGEGHSASAIRNAVKPLQAIYRRARVRGGLPVNPTHDLELPKARPREVEIVSPEDAARLLAALPEEDRPLWATALYAGLRYGELRALRWGALDFAAGTIAVRESWDPKEGSITPKSRASRRVTPMPGLLRDLLLQHRLRRGEPPADVLVFGEGTDKPFGLDRLYWNADRAWKKAKLKKRLRLHQARHTYASFMIAAGVNPKALSAFMGHSSITVTFDLYGHLMPGTEAEAATLLGTYLDAQINEGERVAREAEDVRGDGATGTRTGTRDSETA